MSWVKLDDRAATHPKVVRLGDAAFRLWITVLGHCQQHMTDGLIDRELLPFLPRAPQGADLEAAVAELIKVRLWDVLDEPGAAPELWVHDYLDYNPSRAELLSKRAEAAERMDRARGGRKRVSSSREPIAHNSLTDREQTENVPRSSPNPDPDPHGSSGSASDPEPTSTLSIIQPARIIDVPCPADLQLTGDEVAQLQLGCGVTEEFVARATPQFRAAFLSSTPRTVDQWRRSLLKAITVTWSDPQRRAEIMGEAPTKPPRAKARGQPNYGSAENFAQRMGIEVV